MRTLLKSVVQNTSIKTVFCRSFESFDHVTLIYTRGYLEKF